jgi:hypothetical protein
MAMRKRVAQLLLVLGFILTSLWVTQSPASAATRCSDHAAGFGNTFRICTEVSGGRVRGVALLYDIAGGHIPGSKTIYVQQCRGDGSHCSTIAAQADSDLSAITSWKPTSFGHVYRTCGTAGIAVGVCSRFISA